VSTEDFQTLVFVFQPNIALPSVMCGKAHCHYEKPTCPAKDTVFINEFTDSKFQNLKSELLVDCF